MVLAPVIHGKKDEHKKVFENARKNGFARVRIDGSLYELEDEFALDKNVKHSIELVIDRLSVKENLSERLSDSIETAIKLSGDLVIISCSDKREKYTFSQYLACPECGISLAELSPRMFSFNSPYGACKAWDI